MNALVPFYHRLLHRLLHIIHSYLPLDSLYQHSFFRLCTSFFSHPESTMTVNDPKRQVTKDVYLLRLNDAGAPDVPNEYIYLPPPSDPPYQLRFEIEGTSSICRQGSLWTNIPRPGSSFQRDTYQEHR